MRQGEILDLNWEQVEFEQKAIYVASIQDRTIMKNSDEQPVEVELRSFKVGRLVRRACFHLCPHGFEADNLQGLCLAGSGNPLLRAV
jgi:hypothetical protein